MWGVPLDGQRATTMKETKGIGAYIRVDYKLAVRSIIGISPLRQ